MVYRSFVLYDLFIIGGGINGAGVARDAAGRGLKVLLIDKGNIVERGKHEKLLEQNKIYADLWNVQVGI